MKKSISRRRKNRYRGDEKIDIAATKKSISRRQKINIATTKNRYRGDKKSLSRQGNRAGLLKNRGGLATISKSEMA
jgi:hypothetical protein